MMLLPLLICADLLATLVAVFLVNWWAPLFAVTQTYRDADLDTGARGGMVSATSTYWARVQWLYRNPAYGDEHAPGFTFFARSTDGRFNLHCIRAGLRIKLGWKDWNMVDGSTGGWRVEPWGPEWRIPFVFSISKV